jgi:nucleoid-associated protein YgaU
MAHAPAHTDAHAPKLEAPKAAPKHEAPKMAAAPKAHTLPVAPHQPAYKPKPMTAPSEEPMTTPDMPEMNEGGTQPEAAVAVPKRVPAPRTDADDNNGYYRVQPGDTLSSIAYRYLGNANFWPEVHAANRDAIKNPHYIRIGQRIVLPKGAPHRAKAHRATTHHYVVKPGDSLSRIAMEQMGDMTQWHKIFQANRTAIANPRFIYPGQRLTIPG